MLLMAIAPLSAWGHSTVRTLGRAIWKPAVAALVITVLIFFTYTRNWIALAGFFLVALTILVTLYEFWRGARARQRTQGENFFSALSRLTGRNRRRYGGYIIHISMMLMAIGILGIEIFQTQTQGTIQVGESLDLQGYRLIYQDIAQWDDAGEGVNHTRAVIEVYKEDQLLTSLYPRTDYYYDAQQPMTIPGVRSTLADDVYILLVDWEPASAVGATFKLYINPLVNWLWIGSLAFLLGVIVAAWPEKEPEAETVSESRRSHQTSAAD